MKTMYNPTLDDLMAVLKESERSIEKAQVEIVKAIRMIQHEMDHKHYDMAYRMLNDLAHLVRGETTDG